MILYDGTKMLCNNGMSGGRVTGPGGMMFSLFGKLWWWVGGIMAFPQGWDASHRLQTQTLRQDLHSAFLDNENVPLSMT